MSQLEMRPANDSKTKRKVHHSLRIDMTPMVDLGFLLISFFIFTTTLSQKTTMDLIVPVDGGEATPVPESKTLSFILASDDKVYAYEGIWETSVNREKIRLTNYSPDGIRNIILSKQKQLQNADDLIVVIKPLDASSYKNTIDALDEMIINGVTKYSIVEPTSEEKRWSIK
ncbi:MAG: ExbD/TolR family protein [Flavisolibacter sp.]